MARRMRIAAFAPLVATVLLAACGDTPDAVVPDIDPALVAALGEPLMIDPDLVAQNRANSAIELPSQDRSLPTIENGPEAIAAAREEALRLVGGPGRLREAPEAGHDSRPVPGIAADCAERAEKTALWAARLPATFPVYPLGSVQEATGTDAAGCALRVVSFETPVPLGEVVDFYFTRARDAGYSADRATQQGDDVVSGTKGGASYVVYARRLPSGNTAVDLVTSRRR
jgi:hypothetical protein